MCAGKSSPSVVRRLGGGTPRSSSRRLCPTLPLPAFIRDAVRWLFAAVLAHQYVVLFFVVAIEEAGVPLPAPTDVVIAFFGYRARSDLPELAQVVLVCPLASTPGTLFPSTLARRLGVYCHSKVTSLACL